MDRCSLPCVEAADCGSGLFSSRPDGAYHCRMKLCLQKRLGPDSASFGKTSRLLLGRFCMDCSAFRQGNQVAVRGDIPTVSLKGNRSHWQQRAETGEIQLDHIAQSLRAGPPSSYFFNQRISNPTCRTCRRGTCRALCGNDIYK